MQTKTVRFISAFLITMSIGREAAADLILLPKYPLFSEIDAIKPSGNAGSLVAASMMGVWGNDAAYTVPFSDVNIVADTKILLREKCQLKSGVNNWPEGCTPNAMATVLSQTYAPQYWLSMSYASTQQQMALERMISAMYYYKSPSVLPLFGHADHWATLKKLKVTDNLKDVLSVELLDAGFKDPNMPEPDAEGTDYFNGLKVFDGGPFKSTYYKMMSSAILTPSDPSVNRYLFLYDPPKARDPRPDLHFNFLDSAPLVEPGEMTLDLAPVLVWDALDEMGMLSDRSYTRLLDATPGDAWAVDGVWPNGDPWNYMIVPMYDDNMRDVIALVGISATDGSFEMMQYFPHSRSLDLFGAPEAVARAARLLGPGEVVAYDRLAWDPRSGAAHSREPLLPYHELTVRSKTGATVGHITIQMDREPVRRR